MAESVYTKELLKELQSLSLFEKIELTKDRIEDWYMTFHGNVCVSFSGGKDSTVLLHLVRSMYPDVPAVFSDTGLEYPELKAFVRKQDNVTVIRPKMTFNEVITQYGYPIVGKEVAEAIYYARRILPEDRPDGDERERERERTAKHHRDGMGGESLIKRMELTERYRGDRQNSLNWMYQQTVSTGGRRYLQALQSHRTVDVAQRSDGKPSWGDGLTTGVTEPG